MEGNDIVKFELLADSIKKINNKAGNAAKSAVNQLLTLRNWAIGYYIVEYEQAGSDRAEYGKRLLRNLEDEISERGMNVTLFKACRQFYLQYPQIGAIVSAQFNLLNFEKSSTVSNLFVTDPEQLINNLSFSHIREIMAIELKNDEFKHEDLGQLNAYVAYYKKNEMMAEDNPPVGILLCTDKGSQMVEYALSGMDNQLFVSTYMLHLPDKKKLEAFMLKEMAEIGMDV